MMVLYKHRHVRNTPLTVQQAVAHALSDHDPEARQRDVAELVGRLIVVLNRKGTLLPAEIIEVLGSHNYEAID